MKGHEAISATKSDPKNKAVSFILGVGLIWLSVVAFLVN